MEAEIFLYASGLAVFPTQPLSSGHRKLFLQWQSGQGVKLAIHLDLVMSLWILAEVPHFFSPLNGVVVR